MVSEQPAAVFSSAPGATKLYDDLRVYKPPETGVVCLPPGVSLDFLRDSLRISFRQVYLTEDQILT